MAMSAIDQTRGLYGPDGAWVIARRQGAGYRVFGENENPMKREVIDVPEAFADSLGDQGIRLALRYATGVYRGITPPMVSVYLVPRNKSQAKRTLVETLVLTPWGNAQEQLTPLAKTYYYHHAFRGVREGVVRQLPEILGDYLAAQDVQAEKR